MKITHQLNAQSTVKYFFYQSIIIILILGLSVGTSSAQNTYLQDISANNWKIWTDTKAQWVTDKLFLPPVNVQEVPINPPTCGWEKLWDGRGKNVQLPANVEEHFWGENGTTYGISSNYKGVAWFFTEITIPENLKGKKVILDIESLRIRGEIFVNEQLVGYDLINSTPLGIDISEAVKYGSKNKIEIRITDGDGNFEWMDLANFNWGDYKIPPSHGFCGITGKVFIRAIDKTYIQDVFVKNKPIANSIDVEVSLNNEHNNATEGEISYEIIDPKNPSKILFYNKKKIQTFEKTTISSLNITLKDAQLWSPEKPNLYQLTIKWIGKNGTQHTEVKKIGFRWFEVKTVNGDKQFYLNNQRIVIRTSISWGYWPINGIAPSYELAKKQIQIAKDLGLNMLNFHRHMGQTMLLDLADEMGLLYYAEPGGYKTGTASTFTADWNREKMARMIKRDRSHPSLVIYNMINESTREPVPHEVKDIAFFHQLDPSRCITFTSTNFTSKLYNSKLEEKIDKPAKMHMLPYDTTVYYKGWWDMHFAEGPGVYKDELYKNPKDFLRNSTNQSEIIFWGEEGAIGTPPRLLLAKQEFEKAKTLGYDGDYYIDQYHAFDKYLKEKKFEKAFPNVDSLCVSFGNNAMYYQGRIIENIRISNTVDGYVVNGWENTKIENHSGVVDVWRNPKGNPAIMAKYNQPLYVAVKIRNKVLAIGDSTAIDFHIVNEKNIKGKAQLLVQVTNNKQQIVEEKNYAITISGGNVYGELLKENHLFIPKTKGYSTVNARILQNNIEVASGSDQVFVADLHPENITTAIAINDTSGTINKIFSNSKIPFYDLKNKMDFKQKIVVLAGGNDAFLKNTWQNHNDFLEWVADGNVAICLKGSEAFCEFLEKKEVADYYGSQKIGTVWYGGNFFNKTHPFFNDLPDNTAFNWEYQCFSAYNKERIGLRLKGEEAIVGTYADHRKEMYTSVAILPLGRGKIIVSTLDFAKSIAKENNSSAAVAKKLLENYLIYAQDWVTK